MCFILAALLLSQTVNAQKHHKSKLSEDIDLPVDFAHRQVDVPRSPVWMDNGAVIFEA
jgi:hypothetical protein